MIYCSCRVVDWRGSYEQQRPVSSRENREQRGLVCHENGVAHGQQGVTVANEGHGGRKPSWWIECAYGCGVWMEKSVYGRRENQRRDETRQPTRDMSSPTTPANAPNVTLSFHFQHERHSSPRCESNGPIIHHVQVQSMVLRRSWSHFGCGLVVSSRREPHMGSSRKGGLNHR